MSFTGILIALPVIRHAKHNVHMRHSDQVSVRPPYSVMCSALGGLLCLIITLVLGVRLLKRKTSRNNWYRFTDELIDEKEKKSGLNFYAEPLPVKAPLPEVNDFSDLKPSEEYEPEKKQIE